MNDSLTFIHVSGESIGCLDEHFFLLTLQHQYHSRSILTFHYQRIKLFEMYEQRLVISIYSIYFES